jgi:uncharacterized protein
VEALLVLYEATFETRRFVRARELADTMIARFRDEGGAGFFTTSNDHEALIVRPKDFEDHPIPSGNSSAAYGLLRLTAFTAERSYEGPALEVLRLLHQAAGRHPQAFGHLLQALCFHLSPKREVAIVGDSLDRLAEEVRRRYRPTIVLAGGISDDPEAEAAVPLLEGRTPVEGKPAAYVCENFACKVPVTEPEALERQLEEAR